MNVLVASRRRVGSHRLALPQGWVAGPPLIAAAVVVGTAGVLAVSPLGSGDYGQWLMASRPYLGESIPSYRDGAVPPVVPWVTAMVGRAVGDGATSIHVTAVLIFVALAAAAYLAAASLFRSRLAGALAIVAAFLLTDVFFDLFAFGGLLQAGSLAWLLFGVAAYGRLRFLVRFSRGTSDARSRRARWVAFGGAACIGLAGLTHMGTATIAVPAGIMLALIAAWHADQRRRRMILVPLGVALAVVAVIWLIVLLPGATELTRNPASLAYRGPDRLLDALVAYWSSIAMIAVGTGAVSLRAVGELRRRQLGPWTMLAAWLGVTVGVVSAALVSSASTDYPRFATPLLAPLVLAFAGVAAHLLTIAATTLRRRLSFGSRRGWATALLTTAVIAATPWSVGRFSNQIAGYALADAGAMNDVAAWVDAHVSNGTVLAPVREGKWIEGLTGRDTLFAGDIRYSFRPAEWDRSLAAAALLRSQGALVNANFVVRLTDPEAPSAAPRTLAVEVNHGGEYVDLLASVPSETTVVDAGGTLVARLANLAPDLQEMRQGSTTASVVQRWAGTRANGAVNLRQTVSLVTGGSTLVVTMRASGEATVGGSVELAVRPAALGITGMSGDAHERVLTFGQLGTSPPAVRLVAGSGASFSDDADGTLRLRSRGPALRLLVTALTASPIATVGAAALDPSDLVDRFDVRAAVLLRDATFDARLARLEALGFLEAATYGPYVVLARHEGDS